MLSYILLIILGAVGTFLAEVNGQMILKQKNLKLESILKTPYRKSFPKWIFIVYIVSSALIWIGFIGIIISFFKH